MSGSNPLPLEILEFVAQQSTHPTIQELAEGLHLRLNTAYRAVEELERAGWIKVSGRPKRLQPSLRAALISTRVVRRDRVRNALFPNAVDVATQTGWVCNISYYENGEAIYTDQVEFYAERLLHYPIGQRLPATCCAGGKILLAYQPPEEIERVASLGTRRFTARTKFERGEILEEIKLTRERGYSYVEGEAGDDIVGLGVAVFDESGAPVGSLGVGAVLPIPPDYIEKALPALRRSAERASLELGYAGRSSSRRAIG